MNLVQEIIEKDQKELEKFKTIQVTKHLECRSDLGMLMLTDPNELDEDQLKAEKDAYLLQLTRDNVQLLVNEIWELPTERVEECVVVRLPPPTTVLPRTRKCPGPKQMTKWEKFAKEKGIKKKRKDKKVYDKELDKWVPTYGFKRSQAEKDKNWVLEVPKTADPMEDQFQKKMDLRSEKVAKNEIQRMRNIVRAKKGAVPRTGYMGPQAASASEFLTAASVAKASTASVGKFQDKLPKEKMARGLGVKELIPGLKRKASHISDEKSENIELIKSVLSKRPKFDADKAISMQKRENRQRASNPEEKGKKGGKKGKGNKGKRRANFKSKSAKKVKSGATGERVTNKKQGGRKRR